MAPARLRALLLTPVVAACPTAPPPPDDGDDDNALRADCGNGIVEAGEDCDGGDASTCGCTEVCTFASADTACDDGLFCTADDHCDGLGACVAGAPRDCADPLDCTIDSCDEAAADCVNVPWSGPSPSLFDAVDYADASTLAVEVLATELVWEGITPVTVATIRYTSWESDACVRTPIRLEAFLAMPQASRGALATLPAVVVAHGLGGNASVGMASGAAADVGGVALAYSGPGQGASEGWGSVPDHLFDTVDDPHDAWFWEHALAAMRAVTVLTTVAEVDPSRIAMQGYSGGAVATWIVGGSDARLSALAPVSGTGYLDLAARATPVPGWEADLLAAMTDPQTVDGEAWAAFDLYLDPKNFIPTITAPTLLINGAQDQFFPANSTAASMSALQGDAHRLWLIKDWDHGPIAASVGDGPALDAKNLLSRWGRAHLLSDLPAPPRPALDTVDPATCFLPDAPWVTWNCARVVAHLDFDPGVTVLSARFFWSTDSALTFSEWNLQPDGAAFAADVGTFDGTVLNAANTVFYVEFEMRDSLLGTPYRLSSVPNIPPGFSPNILPMPQ